MVRLPTLVVYRHPLQANAATIMDHVRSFGLYSNSAVWEANVLLGFPQILKHFEFERVILHYSLFGSGFNKLNAQWLRYIGRHKHITVFFQDEFQYIPDRLAFCRQFQPEVIYSLYQPRYFSAVYQEFASRVRETLAGYVSDTMLFKAWQYSGSEKSIDVGYRARRLPEWMGEGGTEKGLLGDRFLLEARGFQTDIMVCEAGRLYGDDWWKFLGSCKFCLGTESGVSLTDLKGAAQAEYTATGRISREALEKWDHYIPYRMISQRVFEAAAFRVCQILYPGYYNGLLQSGVHYIPLEKDFSNMAEVRRAMKNESLCRTMTDMAYQDFIKSGKYHYREFVKGIDLPPAPHLKLATYVMSEFEDWRQRLKKRSYAAVR